MRIALAGNPNSGKTTLYNALTGKNEKVGNWAGVTVEKKEFSLKKAFYNGETTTIIDLPGAYSMSPFTKEESITSEYILNENIDVIVNVIDSNSLSRSLFFTTQILELGLPTIIALNKVDDNSINSKLLSEKLSCPVVEITNVSNEEMKTLVDKAISLKNHNVKNNNDFNIKDDKKRYDMVNKIINEVVTENENKNVNLLGDKIDSILTNKFLGIPIFIVVMFFIFQISQVWIGTPIADWLVGNLELFQSFVGSFFESANPLLYALLVDGIIGGVIAVVGFLPLVMVLYFLIALLEDCGYMARVAVILDPIFKRVGLSGKSVIPFVITIGCAVPGIMASRTIRNEKERYATAMLAPFVPCGAKIPIIALFAGAFFDSSGYISTLMYFIGIVFIFVGALIINYITGNDPKKSFFIIELPTYKTPSFINAFKSMCSRGYEYILKAATIILLCNTLVQIMQTFDTNFAVANSANDSILAFIANPIAYLLVPIIGVLSWQMAAAAVTGFIAKENVVGTLAVCFVGLENFIDVDELALIEGGGSEVATAFAITKVAALSYMMFNLYSPPCFAAIGAMNAEMKNKKWLFGAIGLQIALAYTISYLVYTIGTLIFYKNTFNLISAIAGGVAVITIYIIIFVIKNINNKKLIEQ